MRTKITVMLWVWLWSTCRKEQTGDTEFSLGIDPYTNVSSIQKKKAPPRGATTPEAVNVSLAKKSSSTVKRLVSSDRNRPRVYLALPANKRSKRSLDCWSVMAQASTLFSEKLVWIVSMRPEEEWSRSYEVPRADSISTPQKYLT